MGLENQIVKLAAHKAADMDPPQDCLRMSTTRQLASPRASDLGEKKEEVAMPFMI